MIRSTPLLGLLIAHCLLSSLVACRDDAAQSTADSASAIPFSGEQLDRIEAGLRADAPDGAALPDPRPLWLANELRDDGMRLVVHVRLPLRGDLDNLARHQSHCAHVRQRMRDFLLPGQRVEIYLVFDDSAHACLDEG